MNTREQYAIAYSIIRATKALRGGKIRINAMKQAADSGVSPIIFDFAISSRIGYQITQNQGGIADSIGWHYRNRVAAKFGLITPVPFGESIRF